MSRACSIIIVTYNSADHIDACLRGLAQLHLDEPPEIIVVDNASSDDTVSVIQARHPTVKLLPQQENWGFAGGVNRGVQAANGGCCGGASHGDRSRSGRPPKVSRCLVVS